jgi:hypothetical protein
MSTRRVNWICVLPVALVLWAVAVEAVPPTAADPPDADFLEFLGSWTSGNDQPKWVDPFQVDDPIPTEPDQITEDQSRNRRDATKQKQRDDKNPSREPSSSSVRPGGGVNP